MDSEREAVWVETHSEFVARAFSYFVDTGTWPELDWLQRHFDQTGIDIDVRVALEEMPDEARSYGWTGARAVVPLRVLWHLVSARPVLEICLALLHRARQVYLSDAEDLAITSEDPEIVGLGRPLSVRRAVELVSGDYPNPFAGGGWSDAGWQININRSLARGLRGVESLPDYFEWQARVAEEGAVTRSQVSFRPPNAAFADGEWAGVNITPLDTESERLAATVGRTSDRLVLVGAGASVEAGLPTGQALAREILEQADLPLLARTLDVAVTDGYPDIERAFSLLEALADVDRSGTLMDDLRRLDALHAPVRFDPARARAELLDIRRLLRRSLWMSDGLGDNTSERDVPDHYEPPSNVAYLIGLVNASLGGTIASLNYDNSLELAGGPLVRAFRPDSKRIVVPEEQNSVVRLLKLHGSLDWERIDDDVLRGARPLDRLEYEPAIIFGAANKLRHYGPFLDLLRAFTAKLTVVHFVLVIGYGFRDPHINEALRVWANTPAIDGAPKHLMVCCGAHATQGPHTVQEWRKLEHLQVDVVTKDAGAMIQMLGDRPIP